MQHDYGIHLAFLELQIHLNSSVIPDYSGIFINFEVCSIRIYVGMCLWTIDLFKKCGIISRIYNEWDISWTFSSIAEVVLHTEHPPFSTCQNAGMQVWFGNAGSRIRFGMQVRNAGSEMKVPTDDPEHSSWTSSSHNAAHHCGISDEPPVWVHKELYIWSLCCL